MPASAPSISFFLCVAALVTSTAPQAPPTLDPTELHALETLFGNWGISSSMSQIPWNVSGIICSAGALGDFQVYDNPNFNPGILCDCSYINGSICHVSRLKAHGLGLVGVIPRELERFTYLNNLNIAKNYLSGPLPAYIGNFSYMKYLSIGNNPFSGGIPKELGKLQNLISLGMNNNNFSGTLPQELGNMTSLEQIYVDSNDLIGQIPMTFSYLDRLKFMVASDNDFDGKLPDFIGNLSNLQSLMLQGNSLQGPIPSSFVNLVKLNDLRLGDLDGRSSLGFLANLTSLGILVLRNCKISDVIPPNIEEYRSLKFLDLSFNNLSGVLPPALFNLESLESLFLGGNNLTGTLPEQKSSMLTTIDLSYNDLSGSMPSWVNDRNLQLNLVANSFFSFDSSESDLPRGLYCLQKNQPCNRDFPVYYSFAINCGGPKVTSSQEIIYDDDSYNLSSASYYVTDSRRWAVSSIGSFLDHSAPMYTEITSSQIQNTTDSKLYQSSRASPSLRYYGLQLENGNYSVELLFSEISFPNNNSWTRLGRRIFDIYLQGNIVAKRFDIRKEAGGNSFTAVRKQYITTVSTNFLEIHFFWAGKGTCCTPYPGYYGPLVSAISVTPNFKPTVNNRLPSQSTKKHLVAVIWGSAASVLVLCSLLVLIIYVWWQKKLSITGGLAELESMPHKFSYSELRRATAGFSHSNKLGEGGFGMVYKGRLADGSIVAVKQLSEVSLQGKNQFLAEINIISSVNHQNLVKLYGFCLKKKKRLLVYEYLENKSLDLALFGRSMHLDWPNRFEICLGTARGLAYLHEESSQRIVHRDIKASNILLDSDLVPKISDFGLAKLYDDRQTHVITRVAGTIGYLAPEYAMRGHLTEKVDVFSFGVVALELVCGRQNTDPSLGEEKMYLLEWAWRLHGIDADLEIVDPYLKSYNREEVLRVIGIALLCTQAFASARPSMSRVVSMLIGNIEVDATISKPGYLADWHLDDASGSSSALL